MERCRTCGRGPALAGWCSECRHRARTAGPTGQATVLGVGTESGRARAVPGPLWAAIGTFGGSAVLTVLVALVGGGGLLIALSALVIAGVLGLLAHQLYRGSRAARALAVIAAVVLLALAVGTGSSPGTGIAAWWVLIALATVGAAGTLVLAPSVHIFFAGPFGRASDGPISVVLVRIVAFAVGGVLGLVALGSLLGALLTLGTGASTDGSPVGALAAGFAGVLGGAMIAFAVVEGGIAAFWFWAATALGAGRRGARVAVTVVSGIDALVLLVTSASSGAAGTLLAGLALHASVVVALWVPSDARRHFGEVPLPAVEEWRRRVLAPVGPPLGGAVPPVGPSHPGGQPQPAARPSTVAAPAPGPSSAPSSALLPEPRTEPILIGRHARPAGGVPAPQPLPTGARHRGAGTTGVGV